jgi:hypothetical protein
VAAQEDLEVKQLDFDTAFLNANVKEEIYLKIPFGFRDQKIKEGYVLKLNKALYGLKQAPRAWYLELNSTLELLGYKSSTIDECVYVKVYNNKRIYLTLYVDDTLIIYPKDLEEVWLKDKEFISHKYPIKDMGDCNYILNMEVKRDRKNKIITLSQRAYLEKMLNNNKEYIQGNRKVSTPYLYRDLSGIPEGVEPEELNEQEHNKYRSIVGELLYAANYTRIDLIYIVNVLARHVNKPYNYHMAAARRVLQYLVGRTDKKLIFNGKIDNHNNSNEYNVTIYVDSSYGDDKVDRKSTCGWLCKINNNLVSWQSKKQSTVATSTTEAEFYGLCEATKEALFMKQWIKYYTGQESQVTIMGDNQGSLFIADHNTSHNRTKHIDIQYHFIREHVRNKNINMKYVNTKEQLADILTKPTPKIIFTRLNGKLLF